MAQDVKEWVESCIPCQASVGTVTSPPMELRETPENVFQHCSADFKGPIAGDYYLHVLIDNLSRYPVVQIVKSTSFASLKPKLDDMFAMFGVPESITHDGGSPYNSGDWKDYAKEQGFE